MGQRTHVLMPNGYCSTALPSQLQLLVKPASPQKWKKKKDKSIFPDHILEIYLGILDKLDNFQKVLTNISPILGPSGIHTHKYIQTI